MASKIDLISNALLLLGHDVLSSLNDPGRVARVAVNLYDDIKRDELTSSNWAFARFKVQLSKLVAPPISEFSNAYQLPPDMLKVLWIQPRVRYKIYGNELYTNESGAIYMDYIGDVSESRFTASFSRMLSFSLAVNYAIPIRDGITTSQLLEQRYIRARMRATQADSSQNPQDVIKSNPFRNSRFSGSR